jgi:hypothetical protein
LRRLSFAVNSVLGAPNQNSAAKAGNQDGDGKPIERGACLGKRN